MLTATTINDTANTVIDAVGTFFGISSNLTSALFGVLAGGAVVAVLVWINKARKKKLRGYSRR